MTRPEWSLLTRIAFRFSFLFILSFILIMNNGAFPLFQYLNGPIVRWIYQFTSWFAEHVLHHEMNLTMQSSGSGDTSYHWITLLILCLIAIVGAIIWSIVDKNRKSYYTCYYWLTAIIRYYIAFMLINYGAIKLIHAQMPPPSLDRLTQPLGEFSPMGLAWTYFGYSKGYNIFIGSVEILAGLLLFRKTVVLGALITMATSINIMATNYFFDVPVKIISTALFAMSLFLLLPYIKRLFELLVLGRPAQLSPITKPKFDKRWKNRIMSISKIAFVSIFLLQQISNLLNRQKLMDQYFKKSPLYGIYHIESSNETRKSIPTDWMSIVFEHEGNATVRDKYYRRKWETPKIDTTEHTISLNHHTFAYVIMENGDIHLTKTFDDRTEEIKLIKQNPEKFELMKRPFNWIQEHPYNR